MNRIFLFLIFITHCNSQIVDEKKMKCIEFSDTFPILNNTGALKEYLNDSFLIYYFKDMVLLERPHHYLHMDDEDITRNFSEIRRKFFIYNKTNPSGYYMDTTNLSDSYWCDVDSFLNKQDFIQNSKTFYNIFLQNETHMLSSVRNKDSGTLHEVYAATSKNDTTIKSTIYLSYIQKNFSMDFSLSPHLDSLKNMKLYRNRVVTQKKYWPKFNITVDDAEFSNYIREIEPPNEEVILRYFQVFEKEIKNKKAQGL